MSAIEVTDQPQAEAGTKPRSVAAAVVYAMALLSGAAGLIYEVTWARMLALTFGSTTLSASAVVAGFMGGMGLGAWLYHLAGDRVKRPLLLYGYLELGIAITTSLLTAQLYALPSAMVAVTQVVPEGAALNLIRVVSVLLLLLIPSALMGATYPALCTVLIRDPKGVDRHLGMIYGINTVGAAAGAILGGMILIERFGLSQTVTMANFLNGIVALVAFLLANRIGNGQAAPIDDDTPLATEMPRVLTGTVLLLSGFATLSYEMLWFRALRYAVGNSTYAFTVVLVVFLSGLGLGSVWMRRFLGHRSAERQLAIAQLGTAAAAMIAIALAQAALSTPSLQQRISIYSGAFAEHGWVFQLAANSLAAAIFMLPATLLMGVSFPLASRLYLGDVRHLGQRVGGAYLLANIGSIAGALLAAVWILPQLGTIGGTKFVALINLALGTSLVWWRWRRFGAREGWLPAAAWGIVAVLAVVLPGRLTFRGEPGVYNRGKVVYEAEGDLATVQVLDDTARSEALVMTIDGCAIGCTRNFMDSLYLKEILLAHLPMALDGGIKQTLNVGLGSASTLDAVAAYPQIESLDCVEINAPVVEAAALFPEGRVLKDPRANVSVDDALYYLLRSPKRYDAIISDGKQNPDYPGNATMLCHDFYRYALNRLDDDGLFIQWIPMGMLHSELKIVIRNLCDVFPHVAVFYFPEMELLMVGSREPLVGRSKLSEEDFNKIAVDRDLKYFGIKSADALLAHYVCNRDQLLAAVGPGPLSTWNHNRIEFMDFKASRQERAASFRPNLNLLIAASQAPDSGDSILVEVSQPQREAAELVRRAYQLVAHGHVPAGLALAEKAVALLPDDLGPKRHLAYLKDIGRRMSGGTR